MRRGICAGALIAALATGTAGCGGGSDSDKVKDSVKGFFSALADRDGKKACDLLSKSLVEQAKSAGGDCAKSVSAVASQAVPNDKRDEARNVTVSSVKVKGTTATATVKGKKGSRQLILRKEGGKWKLATL
jgi:hypothetical protein